MGFMTTHVVYDHRIYYDKFLMHYDKFLMHRGGVNVI